MVSKTDIMISNPNRLLHSPFISIKYFTCWVLLIKKWSLCTHVRENVKVLSKVTFDTRNDYSFNMVLETDVMNSNPDRLHHSPLISIKYFICRVSLIKKGEFEYVCE
jgi:hypothetical protein